MYTFTMVGCTLFKLCHCIKVRKGGSFHAKTTTFQNSCQVTPSDFAHIHTICASIGRMNTQKKSAANSLRFRKYSSSKIWPDPPFLASAHRVIDLSDLWPAFIPICNKIQKSKLLLGVIFTHIFKIRSQKHDILFTFYAKVPQHGLSSHTTIIFSMFKVMRFLNKRRQGAHITYICNI